MVHIHWSKTRNEDRHEEKTSGENGDEKGNVVTSTSWSLSPSLLPLFLCISAGRSLSQTGFIQLQLSSAGVASPVFRNKECEEN